MTLLCTFIRAQGPGGMYIRGAQGPGGQNWQGQRGGQNWQGQGGRGGQGPVNQNIGFISGRVWFLPEDENDKEVPGAGTVVIVVTSKKDTLFTTVAESGRFRIFNVPTGTAQVRFTMIGYAEEGHPMDVTPG